MSGSMFGGISIADRLKAAVNTLEQTGSSLQAQARAMSQQQQQQQQGQQGQASGSQSSGTPRPDSPSVSTSQGGSKGVAWPLTSGPGAPGSPARSTPVPAGSSSVAAGPSTNSPSSATSPTRAGTYISHAAGDAFTGLRKSLHFGRSSIDSSPVPSFSSPNTQQGGSSPAQELKDIPHVDHQPRPTTPSRLLGASAPSFTLGSGPSSLSNTRSQSPLSHAAQIPLPKFPLHALHTEADLPRPDPSDPATYPLPPSPTLSPLLSVPPLSAGFSDPLGASPNLDPVISVDVPTVELVAASKELENDGMASTVDKHSSRGERKVNGDVVPNGIGLGVDGVDLAGMENGSASGSSTAVDAAIPDPAKDLETANSRLKDLSSQYSTLHAQMTAADKVLKDLTPLEGGVADHEALEGWVRMMNAKVVMITEEMKRLQGQIALQGARMEEIRDTHRLEGTSQGELIAKLRTQLSTAESNLAARATELLMLSNLKTELSKAQTLAKEEEEKRTKAISLLKTVRMKLVKVEKEKEEIERDRAEERAERSTAKDELERFRADREREVTALRRGFEKELTIARERHEKDLAAKRAAWELEMITTKAAHAKELSGKTIKVNGLEAIVKELSATKQDQFQEIQSRQAEVEMSRAELETLRSRTKDLEFQLREVNERCAMLEDASGSGAGPSASMDNAPGRGRNLRVASDSFGGRSATPSPTRGSQSTSSVDVQRLLAEAEARSETKVADLRSKIRSLESERNDIEEEWAIKLSERVREVERLKRVIQEKDGEYAESLQTTKGKEKVIEEGIEARKALEKEIRALKAQLEESREEVEGALDAERLVKEELAAIQSQIADLKSQLEDSKSYGVNLKAHNKTLREELRKVQSSVQLLERQRNPGVGYWSASTASSNASSSSPLTHGLPAPLSRGMTDGAAGASTPLSKDKVRPSLESSRSEISKSTTTAAGMSGHSDGDASAGSNLKATNDPRNQDEEEVNLEYLRNVILQFLEHKEMRPNLVRVLSVILRFTPQELRRLNAKLLT
ncbi:hypothetical protein BD324DRAFT_625699 [Kockovaella imperatae]|uniref:GRIP domain-containing protein n=1 Tax=Kockovaella imperatae TaxID=4999 RepID=A0A1Y1UIK7_9TREE|nr:hypothetical protein BD324DRAFT_625699 [Kockovaella imperatae]ORX37324.1 hypothetical protein BD324DRAFT_625699 [Kockovaella imperatae]